MPFQARLFLQHQKGVGFYHLSYYQEIIEALTVFIGDEEEQMQMRKRMGSALGMFEVVYRKHPKVDL